MVEDLRITDACVEYADASLGIPKIGDMSAVAFASERRIRRAFAERHGTPPTVYLRNRALKQARLRLLSDGGQVIGRIANDAGFEHHGRFAAHYRDQFGETPSQTRANKLETPTPGSA
jgi:AraC-like DNA-binding protein